MPWRLYDAFVLPQEGCRLATFVAQYEGGCEEMEGVLSDAARDAGAPNATAWFGEAVAGRDECAVCVLGSWEKRNAPVFEAARKRRLEARGGPTRKLECVFDDGTVVASRPTRETFHRRASTLVFECVVPPHLRDAACSDTLGVRIVDGRRAHPRVPLCGFFGIRASTMAACAWTSANEYLDRDGVRRQPTSVRGLREWLAAHLAFGVEAFVVFDDDARWTDPRRSKLWPAVEPLAAVGRAALVPWPWRACGARGDGPWVSVRGGQRSALSIQSFWGRPSQYAAQNACHRRLKSVKWIAHLDVDEFAVPASSLPAAVAPYEARSDVSSLALPHVFYGRCDTGKGDSLLLFSGSRECAGKAQPSRTKQIAKGTAVKYIQDHYVRIGGAGGAKPLTADAFTQARLAHARAGYGFSGPATARFATKHKDKDVPPSERREFEDRILPRLLNDNLDCRDARRDDPAICAAHPRKRRPPPNGTDASSSSSFCWCRDALLRELWLPRVRAELRDWWGLDDF